MKKLFLLSSVYFFIELIGIVLWASYTYAAPPFAVPPKGGLPVCMDKLNACNDDLGTCGNGLSSCTNNLESCNTDLGTCKNDLDQCEADCSPSGQILPGDGYSNHDAFGVSGHGPALSYTEPVPADGTFTDSNTGLMWEKKDDAGGIHDKDNTYTWTDLSDGDDTNFDGTLLSEFLLILNNTCAADESVLCRNNDDCAAENNGPGGPCGFAGYQDWRIPNVKELQSLVDYSQLNPAYSAPGLVSNGAYWSVTTYPGALFTNAWQVVFGEGNVNFEDKSNTQRARAVRP